MRALFPVPGKKLLTWVTLLIPVAALAGLLPELWTLALVLLATTAVIAISDLLLSVWRQESLKIEVPPLQRLTKDRRGSLQFTISFEAAKQTVLRVALGLPPELEGEKPWLDFPVPAGAVKHPFLWPVTPRQRGNFTIDLLCLETPSRFGYWDLRRRVNLVLTVRVYPNLFSDRKELAALFLDRGRSGVQLMRTVGRGREFERLREYQPGDGYDEVHWKSTAKRGVPITKVFQVERTQEVYVIVDASRLSSKAVEHDARTISTLERNLTAALVLLLAAEHQGDRFGLAIYTRGLSTFVRASAGAGHFNHCKDSVFFLQPSEDSPDYSDLFASLRNRLQRRALLIFLTDLSDPVQAEEFLRHVRVLATKHLMLVNQIGTPDVRPVFSQEVETDADLARHLSGHLRWQEAQELASKLHAHGVTLNVLKTETLAANLVSQYMNVKRRQIL